ncbi:Ctr copper transporter family-domain-containing protein [Phaeosphaeriaceae sp. PMI808]|nr:Ctr copper transporter family-domain-containing protein [Phaeosphaeriaceae sp. PMI808]
MGGMHMPTSSEMATATGSDSLAHDAVATAAASAGSGSMAQSASMEGMASYLHFGTGDAFIASFLTPAEPSAYVGVMLLLVLLAVLQRFLQAFTAKMNHELSANVQPSHQVEPDGKNGNWIEIGEGVHPAKDPAMRLKGSVPRAIARSLLQVFNAATGYLVMLAVMTLNAGYILALLAGVFLAEFALSWYKHSHPAAH